MIYIDVEQYVKARKCFPRGNKTWTFKTVAKDFTFTYKGNYSKARTFALVAFQKEFKTSNGLLEVIPYRARASVQGNVMPIFKIKYIDPKDLEVKEVIEEHDSLMWAEDKAYALADKGLYTVWEKIIAPDTVTGFYWKKV